MRILEAADKLNISVPLEVKAHLMGKIPAWQKIWQGDVPWKDVYSQELEKPRKRDLLGAAQTLCAYLARITMSEFTVTADDERANEYINNILDKTKFRERLREADERKEALGSAIIKLYIENGEIKYNFISGANFAPLSWDNGEITDAIFCTHHVRGKKYYTQIERQRFKNGEVIIEQYLFKAFDSASLGTLVSKSELESFGLIERSSVKADKLLFAYVKPAICNRYVPMGCPLGVSRLDGAESVFKAVDIAFDELQVERLMAEKMIFVSQFMVDKSLDIDGVPDVKINKDTRVYQFLSIESKDGQMPETFDPSFRIDEHKLDLQTQLDLLCFKAGVDIGTISFDGQQGIKTAEEIRSENSKTYQTIVDNQKIWKDQLERLFKLTIEVSQEFGLFPSIPKLEDEEITVDFDDAVTPDRKSYINEGLLLLNAGAISRLTFLKEYLGYSQERAEEEIKLTEGELPEPPDGVM